MNTLIKSLLTSTLLLGISTSSIAQDSAKLDKYNNAKISIHYDGNLGYFSQLLAYKLNIAYYANQASPSEKIAVQQNQGETLSALLHKINQQLKTQHLILTTLNEKPTLALVNKQTETLESPQFIGDIIFGDSSLSAKTETSQESIIVIEPSAEESKGEKTAPK